MGLAALRAALQQRTPELGTPGKDQSIAVAVRGLTLELSGGEAVRLEWSVRQRLAENLA
jgi:hypothetical protein